jgi:SSS family solute:Na+ symporter
VAVGDEVNPSLWKKLFGITTEFTRGDKVIYYLTTAWSLFWVANFFVLLAVNLVKIQSDHFWLRYNQWMFYTQLAAGILATIWLCCGGIRDLRDLFRTLATAVRNDNDDGRVADDHHNLGE